MINAATTDPAPSATSVIGNAQQTSVATTATGTNPPSVSRQRLNTPIGSEEEKAATECRSDADVGLDPSKILNHRDL